MRIFTFYILSFIGISLCAQKNENKPIDIGWHVEQKTSDFNTVFTPLYYEKDTLRYQELYNLSQENNYCLGEIIALNLLGTYFRDQSQYLRSIKLHLEALNISKDQNSIDGILYSNNMLGVVYRRMDDVQKGLRYHFKALELAEEVVPKTDFTIRNTAIAINGIGNSYLILQEWASAKKQFQRSFKIEESIGNHLGMAINYQNIGYSQEKLNELDSAQYNYFSSLEENSLIDNKVGEMICYNSIGRIYLLKDQYEKAVSYLNRAEKIALEKGDSFYTATIYYLKGLTLLKKGNIDKAKSYLNKSVELSTQHNLKSNLSDTYKAFAIFYEKNGDFAKAYTFIKKANEVESDYLNENNLRVKNNLEISYETDAKVDKILNLEKEKNKFLEEASKKQRTIFFLALLLVIGALLSVLLYQREKLRKAKQVLELEQKVLRTQMNPHFTFNALNSIKAYIISQNTEKAVSYLNKFAKLMRGVLYSSEKKVITLEEELETVASYVSIERLRFSDSIDLNIDVQNVKLNDVEIPPLILQPFIENALWHGLAKKVGEKAIDIHIYKPSKKTVCIDIIDNGIGREASSQENQDKSYKSLGVNLTTKRLTYFFNLPNNKNPIKFFDLKDENNQPAGTKVSICFPHWDS